MTYLTLAQAAAYLQVTAGALQKRMERGGVPSWCFRRLGRRQYRFIREHLDEWLAKDAVELKLAMRGGKKSAA